MTADTRGELPVETFRTEMKYWLTLVSQAGYSYTLTKRGKPIAVIAPVPGSADDEDGEW